MHDPKFSLSARSGNSLKKFNSQIKMYKKCLEICISLLKRLIGTVKSAP